MLAGAWSGLENGTINLRYAVRGAAPVSDIVVVGVDDGTLGRLRLRWPFARRLKEKCPALDVRLSEADRDPFRIV